MGVRISLGRDRWDAFFAMLLGLFLGTDIAYLFFIGTTPFIISTVYSVALLAWFILTGRFHIRPMLRMIPKGFVFFCIWILFSAVFAFATFLSITLMYRYVVGVIYFVISLTALLDTIILYPHRKSIATGMAWAIVINAAFCIVQYLYYHSGRLYDVLYNLLPQPNFHLSIYNFMTQGLFLEPSHMNRFLSTCIPLWLGLNWKGRYRDYAVLGCGLLSTALSSSGVSMTVYVTVVLFFVLAGLLKKRVSRKNAILATVLLGIAAIGGILILANGLAEEFLGNLKEYLSNAYSGSDITDESNEERLTSILTALSLLPYVPVGCGWNMVHTLLEETALGTASAFSDIVEMLLEIGIVGVSFYLISVGKLILRCLEKESQESKGFAVSLIAILTVQMLTDYAINPCIMVALGLAMCCAKEKKQPAAMKT